MFDTGSTGFMLVCTMLVLLMTPGLAFITTAITPAAGFVEPWAAAVMGFAGSPCCYFAISVCKKRSATMTLSMSSNSPGLSFAAPSFGLLDPGSLRRPEPASILENILASYSEANTRRWAMPQLSLYLDEVTMTRLRGNSEKARQSLSRYVGDLIRRDEAPTAWPEGYWSVYGALSDSSFQVPEELDLAADGSLPAF